MIVFASPAFLWGLAASILPWILRRRLPREIPRVPFAFISFLREVEAQEFISPRLQEWLLLLLRILIVVGLVMAAADPVWVSSGWGETREQLRAMLDTRSGEEAVLLLDQSASMRYTGGEISSWQAAVDQARRVLQSDFGRSWALGFWSDTNGGSISLRDRLHRGNVSDLARILDESSPVERPSHFRALLEEISRDPGLSPVVLITDHQASGWRDLLDSPPSGEFGAPPLWVIPVGERPTLAVWVEIASMSSVPWAAGFDEEIQVTVHQWGNVKFANPILRLILNNAEPVVLAEVPCPLDGAPMEDVVKDVSLRMNVRLGGAVGERDVIPVALELVGDQGSSPLTRITGEIPVLSGRKVYFIGDTAAVEAVRGCLETDGVARAFEPVSAPGVDGIPTDGLLVTALSAVQAQIPQCAAWVRQGGNCLLLLDANPEQVGADLLLKWQSLDGNAVQQDAAFETGGRLGEILSDWPEAAWREWQSPVGGYSPSANSIAFFGTREGPRTDLLGTIDQGLGKIIYVNIGQGTGARVLRSPIFPSVVLESMKFLAKRQDSESWLRAGPNPEGDLRPLTDEERQKLEQTGLVRFFSAEELEQPGSVLAAPVPLRSQVLGIVILLGLIELWLANRGVSS